MFTQIAMVMCVLFTDHMSTEQLMIEIYCYSQCKHLIRNNTLQTDYEDGVVDY